ncbi:hypothetical protein ADL22_10215 [Streptomyces sp. NRRL F-4489]|uniref:hypothetical protein n=1 Tax=Streptomyces sp. NRRL F-4489 TaxID=1609095 RepID=UPI000748E933|nr:hypothetical protein [Streptomyces sp. NRRL F-4489]KUL47429.1 hypothetical protein ADL22_10215 [Streptomyces sp. NRRL F-4489]
MSEQPVFVLGDGLQALEPAGFETEEEFQQLLARHPRVLDFGRLADGQPLRLTLVAREMGVATSTESGPAYWLDHLFVDADGVPTLVEVKRAGDTRIRREVVGQMLDYAANGARYWPAALLQRAFEETCQADGRPLEEAYGELLGERAPEEFWALVEERLSAGQMRLVFVADRIPVELRAIVEFLNGQLRQTDVYAVELTQYKGSGDLRVLVPRIHGDVAGAAKAPPRQRGPQRKRTRAEIDAALEGRCAPEVRRAARLLLDHAEAHGRLVGGTATYPSMNVYYRTAEGELPVGTLSLYDGPAEEQFSFSFGAITRRFGIGAAAAFADALPAVGGLGEKLAKQRASGYGGWPSVPVAALAAEPGAVEKMLAAIEQLVGGRASSS